MILGLIPARGGSNGIPRKNIRPLGGKPLIQWTIEAARASGVLDAIMVSTEDAEIASVATRLHTDVLSRPKRYALDETPMQTVILHALSEISGVKILVLLQPTAPFRKPERIREACDMLNESGAISVVSVAPIPEHQRPDFAFNISDTGKLKPYLKRGIAERRQATRPAYYRDGSVYAVWVQDYELSGADMYANALPLIVPPDEALNIDTEADWAEAERRLLVTA